MGVLGFRFNILELIMVFFAQNELIGESLSRAVVSLSNPGANFNYK